MYFKVNESEDSIHQNLHNTLKQLFGGKCMVVTAYVKIKERSQININV
jgi:hypothetical protein